MTHKINIKLEDIEDYILDKVDIDPVERAIDLGNRYEVFDFGLYDHKLKRIRNQTEDFLSFCQELWIQKNNAASESFKKRAAKRLYSNAPTEVDI
jgi:hypothetical protein